MSAVTTPIVKDQKSAAPEYLRIVIYLPLSLHTFGSGYAEFFKTVGKDAAGRHTQGQACVAFSFVVDEHAFGVVERVEVSGKFLQVHANEVRSQITSRNGERFAVTGKLGCLSGGGRAG